MSVKSDGKQDLSSHSHITHAFINVIEEGDYALDAPAAMSSATFFAFSIASDALPLATSITLRCFSISESIETRT